MTEKSLSLVLTVFDDDNYHARRVEKQFEGTRRFAYKLYFSFFRSSHFLVLMIFLFVLSQALLSGVDFYISNWNVGYEAERVPFTD